MTPEDLSEEVYADLRAVAAREGRPVAALLEAAVERFVDVRASIHASEDADAPLDLQAIIDGSARPPPIAALLGIEAVDVEPGRVVMALEAEPRHANPMGTLHGGVLCDLADLAMGATYAGTLDPDETFATVELSINYLRPVWTEQVRATAELVADGRTLGLVECTVENAAGDLVARASSTCLTLRGDAAANR